MSETVIHFSRPPQRYVNGHTASASSRQRWLCVDCMADTRSVEKCPVVMRKKCEVRELGARSIKLYKYNMAGKK